MGVTRWLVAWALFVAMPAVGQGQKPLVEVWRSPSCGCCEQCVDILLVKQDGSTELYARHPGTKK